MSFIDPYLPTLELGVPYVGFALVVLAAIAFVAWPLRRVAQPVKAKALLGAALALFVLGVGVGIYWMVGRPYLAIRESKGLAIRDTNGLVPFLIARVRKNPDSEQDWIYLAQIYMSAGAADQAADAFGRAVAAERKHGRDNPALDDAYAEALINAAGGGVPPEAERIFTRVLAGDPKSAPARYYLGLARAQHGDRATATQLWKSLLEDVPTTSPLHQELVDRLASIGAAPTVAGSNGAPDISAMVAGLAARLKANPNDPAGWLRLIRAYSVLGDTDKAKAALATARKTVGADTSVKAALDSEASELKLE